MNSANPSATLVVFFYNQRKFVHAAVASAFSQNYEPLEILFSDDCSTDGTFEELQRVTAQFERPDSFRLNRNDRNLGIGGHVNRAARLASGQLLVFMAGDDLSVPDRVETLVRAWQAEGCRADLLHTDMIEISEDGDDLAVKKPDPELRRPVTLETILRMNAHVQAPAYTRRLFEKFDPMPDDIATEDMVLPVRAALLGGLQYVEQPLYRHRVGGISGDYDPDPETSHELLFGKKVKWARWFRDAYRQRLRDMRQYPERAGEAALRLCEVEYRRWKAVVDLAEAPWPRRVALGLGILARHPMDLQWRLRTVLPYLLPAAYAPFYAWRRRQRQRRAGTGRQG